MTERIQNLGDNRCLEYKGVKYRSQLEVKTAEVLDALHIPFEYESRKLILQEGFRCPYQKDKVRSVTYTPDFIIGPIMLECKGFETPEWKIKKKLLFKYLSENEPDVIFHQIHDAGKHLLEALDAHLTYLGFAVLVQGKVKKTGKGMKAWNTQESHFFDSIQQAMSELNLTGKPIGAILRSLTGKTQYVYGYNWQLIKIKL